MKVVLIVNAQCVLCGLLRLLFLALKLRTAVIIMGLYGGLTNGMLYRLHRPK